MSTYNLDPLVNENELIPIPTTLSLMESKRWATEHLTKKGKWVGCDCRTSQTGVIKPNLPHRLREMVRKTVRIRVKEWV